MFQVPHVQGVWVSFFSNLSLTHATAIGPITAVINATIIVVNHCKSVSIIF
jgi:hypothetical protein